MPPFARNPRRDLRATPFDAADLERVRLRRRVRELEEELAYRQREDSRRAELIADQALKLDRITALATRLAERLVAGKPARPGEPMTRQQALAEIEAATGFVVAAAAAHPLEPSQ